MTFVAGSLGLRHRLILAIAAISLLVPAIFAISTYELSRNYLLSQRERTVQHQAFADADFVRRKLESADADISAILTAAGAPADNTVVLKWRNRWYASSLERGRETVPEALRLKIASGGAATQRLHTAAGPVLAVGVHLPSVEAEFYELAPLSELEAILRLLSVVLIGGALLATAAGAGLGAWASRAVVVPLNRVAGTAAAIAAGRLDTRLPETRDPELATIVGSFNSMVDTLQQRIVRDARLAADVSHELRSPLTTLVASVDLLNARRADLQPRSRQALDLITADLDRFRRLLDDLLELARSDAGLDNGTQESFEVDVLLSHVLAEVGHEPELLTCDEPVRIRGDKARLSRLFRNLFENADRHGGGLTAVTVTRAEGDAVILVDDQGPGVPLQERERIFDRFATGRTGRGSSSGTGLGLALVAETATAHQGAVWCTDHPTGGARFVVRFPTALS
ncbi:sensor histidine kinase [Kribbella deserti]|uniref:histidine kinase n=1 Tax=Kribbella deserti TaxID=1926257 RepID=A0ABV6QHH3_9ACTN